MIAPRRGATLSYTPPGCDDLRVAIRWSATTGYFRATLRVGESTTGDPLGDRLPSISIDLLLNL
jgi:hypothetical protein